MLENREISKVSRGKPLERLVKVRGHTPNAYIFEKSDTDIVPEKEPNKVGLSQINGGGSGGKGGDQGEILKSPPAT